MAYLVDRATWCAEDGQETVALRSCRATRGGLRGLADAVRASAAVRRLVFADCLISAASVGMIAEASARSVRSLVIEGCRVRDEGVRLLVAGVGPGLLDLDLSDNLITDEGADELAGLVRRHRALRALRVDGNAIGADGEVELCHAAERSTSIVALVTDGDLDINASWRARSRARARLSALALLGRCTGPLATFIQRDGDRAVVARVMRMLIPPLP